MSVRLGSITFDCRDALILARFWGAVLERAVSDTATPEFAQLPGVPIWSFYAVPEPKTAKNRMHVDLEVAELEAEVSRLASLGATVLKEFDEGGYRWVTLSDPDGNEFDVVAL
jgi:predicted enzyme related to lactoylglutathione lyase